MKKAIGILVLLLIGGVIGVIVAPMVPWRFSAEHGGSTQEKAAEQPAEKKPLYWVAPMDPNYRRDKPGKSPMGMDLIPVYEEDAGGADAGPGTVKISPDVVNNLGVTTAEAKMAELRTVIQTVGYIQYDEDQLVHIHPRISGWVDKLYVKAAGEPVEEGQPLYDIYSPELVNAQEELVLALERKSQTLIRAAQNRLASLRVPQQVIDEVKSSGRVRQTITFVSPQNGVVDNLDIRQGFYVSPGSTMMSIGTLEQVWVEAEVFERQAALVSVGQSVTMTLDYLPGRKWQGEVDYIYPTLDPKTRTVRVRLRFDNEDNLLKPNMFAQVRIEAESSEQTLVVPKESVIRTGRSSRLVLALGDGSFKSVDVEVGRYDEQYAEILDGLAVGEEVVTSAQFLIDSESSKTSDFRRMSHEEETPKPASVWTEATVNSLSRNLRKINVNHVAIPQWQWPEMTMDFDVAESVDLAEVREGMQLHVEISRTDNDRYVISAIHIPGTEESRSLDELSTEGMSLE